MNNPKKNNRVSAGLIAGISAALLGLGGIAAWWSYKSLNPTPPPVTVKPIPNPSSTEQKVAKVYWMNATSANLDLVEDSISLEAQGKQTPQEILTSSLELLLAGPKEQNYVTNIPPRTKLLGLTVESDGIHLNLSNDFTVGGGSEAMIARLAQIIYTSTALDPNGKVWIEVEGEPLEALGGEGLIISQPMTRQDFEENFAVSATK
jgi:spore germination protein GerM